MEQPNKTSCMNVTGCNSQHPTTPTTNSPARQWLSKQSAPKTCIVPVPAAFSTQFETNEHFPKVQRTIRSTRINSSKTPSRRRQSEAAIPRVPLFATRSALDGAVLGHLQWIRGVAIDPRVLNSQPPHSEQVTGALQKKKHGKAPGIQADQRVIPRRNQHIVTYMTRQRRYTLQMLQCITRLRNLLPC